MVNIAFTVNPDDQAASRAVSGGAGKAWFTGRQAEPAEITTLPDRATARRRQAAGGCGGHCDATPLARSRSLRRTRLLPDLTADGLCPGRA